MRAKILFVVAILLGLATTFLFYNYMDQYNEVTTVNENLVDVVVAKEMIRKNQIIHSEMLKLEQVPQLGLHTNVITQLGDVVGNYALADIEAGELLMTHRVQSEKEETALVSRKVRAGYLAASVGINIVQSVSNLIEPEDFVDVLYTKIDTAHNIETTTIILEKVRVLAVGRRMVEVDTENPYVEYSSATLEIKASDRITLIHANETGSISLVLHSRQNTESIGK